MKHGDVFAGDQWTFDWKVMILRRNYNKCWFVGSKGDVFGGDQWTFEWKVMLLIWNYSKSWFIGSRSDFCLGWLIANCHWSPAKRIFSFHLRTKCVAFVTLLQRKWYFQWKCSLVPSETMISVSPPEWREQLLPYVCSERAILLAIVHWSRAKRLFVLMKKGGGQFLLSVCSENDEDSCIY